MLALSQCHTACTKAQALASLRPPSKARSPLRCPASCRCRFTRVFESTPRFIIMLRLLHVAVFRTHHPGCLHIICPSSSTTRPVHHIHLLPLLLHRCVYIAKSFHLSPPCFDLFGNLHKIDVVALDFESSCGQVTTFGCAWMYVCAWICPRFCASCNLNWLLCLYGAKCRRISYMHVQG